MRIQYERIDRWPNRTLTASRKKGDPFQTNWDGTLRKLKYECGRLIDRESIDDYLVIIAGTGVPRVDGSGFRADRPFDHPGIVVVAPSKHGPLKFACDHFTDWRANVHAIALTMERLRLADLYGVGSRGEAFAGFKALPAPIVTPPPMTAGEAAEILIRESGTTNLKPEDLLLRSSDSTQQDLYRLAAKRLHPDRPTHDPERWKRLQEAKGVLEARQ